MSKQPNEPASLKVFRIRLFSTVNSDDGIGGDGFYAPDHGKVAVQNRQRLHQVALFISTIGMILRQLLKSAVSALKEPLNRR